MTEFKITGPGEYMTRDGRKAVISRNDGGIYCWIGKIGDVGEIWNKDGKYWSDDSDDDVSDIIGPWEEPATVSSVLTYAGVTKKPSDVLTWLEFVTVMNSPASTFSGSTKAEKQSEDEAESNEACDEAGDAAEALKSAMHNAYQCHSGSYNASALDVAKTCLEILAKNCYSIVRTSTLGNRNGCYNTRTDKDVD